MEVGAMGGLDVRAKMVWTQARKTLLSRLIDVFQTAPCGEHAVRVAAESRPDTSPCAPATIMRDAATDGVESHAPYLCLTTIALAALALLGLAGCQTPPQNGAPVYGATVPPPGTGMVGQPAPYGGFVSTPQGAAYPPAPPVMPGPTNNWQSAPPTMPAAPAPNSWTWSQPGTPAAPQAAPQSVQQYGNQLSAQANQYAQGMTNQAQQFSNQMQAQPQQWANSTQQAINAQAQQYGNQMQAATNQYQQQLQQNLQSQQQQLSGQMQQATNQLYPQSAPQQQTVNGNWWPFQSPSSVPPARSTPAVPARY
jgi:hypothetical protein